MHNHDEASQLILETEFCVRRGLLINASNLFAHISVQYIHFFSILHAIYNELHIYKPSKLLKK